MSRQFGRFFVSVYLLFALCFQGFAQAKVLTCETPPVKAQVTMADQGHHYHHDHHAQMDHSDGEHHGGMSHDDIKAKCNKCAPCCMGSTLPATVFQIQAVAATTEAPVGQYLVASTAEPRRLERPPRS